MSIVLAVVAIGLVGCRPVSRTDSEQAATEQMDPSQTSGSDAETAPGGAAPGSAIEAPLLAASSGGGPAVPPHETDADWAIARGALEWAWDRQLSSLPVGEVAAMIGATFVGTPYVPGSLEIPGPEALVVNLSAFDCVTLVEHLLVISRLTVAAPRSILSEEGAFRDRYRAELTRVRYRGGTLDGYPSRLHYFSEWLADAEAKGLVRDVTRELGGIQDPRPIRFMSSNPGSYRQLGEDPAYLEAIRATENTLNARPRYYIPEDRIAGVEGGIQNGDIIAAVSTVEGLDIAHTGIALWRDGRVHLLHAPLVGDSVEVSESPLADRILTIAGQSGIMVARPLQP